MVLDKNASVENVMKELVSLKRQIIELFNGSYVICTVAPVDLMTYNYLQREEGRVTLPTVSTNTLWNQTSKIMNMIDEFDHEIILEIFKPHRVFQNLRTASFHDKCVLLKRSADGTKKKQFSPGSLHDGLHPTTHTSLKWLERCHQCAVKIIEAIVRQG